MAKKLILVCTSARLKNVGGECCGSKNAKGLLKAFHAKIESKGLSEEYEVKASGCLKNCHMGRTIKVCSDQIIYGPVNESDLDDIIQEHLHKGKPIPHLQKASVERFWGF